MNEQHRYVDTSKTRSDKHLTQMEKIVVDGICPFCPEGLDKYHSSPLVVETDYWIATPNMHPYQYTEQHLLLIARRHIEHIRDLSEAEWQDLGRLVIDQVVEMPYGVLAARFGDFTHTAASVAHLHFHIIQPQKNLSSDQEIRFKISP